MKVFPVVIWSEGIHVMSRIRYRLTYSGQLKVPAEITMVGI